MFIHNALEVLAVPVLFSIVIFTLMTGSAIADAEEKVTAALPDKFMFRLDGYFVNGSKTSFSVNSDSRSVFNECCTTGPSPKG